VLVALSASLSCMCGCIGKFCLADLGSPQPLADCLAACSLTSGLADFSPSSPTISQEKFSYVGAASVDALFPSLECAVCAAERIQALCHCSGYGRPNPPCYQVSIEL
jgi:hypothetical protein